jgi:transcriptional regulator with XRE-family HTH domain
MNTADRVKQLLRARGVEERAIIGDLAALCGISRQAVGQWFLGSTRRISPDYLAKIAARYRCTMEWLVTGKGNMDAEPAQASIDFQLDDLIGALYARQSEMTAEQHAAIQSLLDNLQRRASARFQKFSHGADKE